MGSTLALTSHLSCPGGELLENVHDLLLGREKASFLPVHALATCHSFKLKMLDGETIGNPLDVKMFDFTRWTLYE